MRRLLPVVVALAAILVAVPAMARDHWRPHHGWRPAPAWRHPGPPRHWGHPPHWRGRQGWHRGWHRPPPPRRHYDRRW